MPQNDKFWEFYWEMRLAPMLNLGKREALLTASELIRKLAGQFGRPLRLLELGCGEGQVIGQLLDAHAQECDLRASCAVDYNAKSLKTCRQDYPGLECVEGDFTDEDLLKGLGKFDLLILVNALHEVFSNCFSAKLNEIDIPAAKQKVEETLGAALDCLEPGAWIVLFDGLEPPGDPQQVVRIKFHDSRVFADFKRFARQYHPLRIRYRQLEEPLSVELSQRHFTRYITKSIFLRKKLWDSERFESYQYFTEEEYRIVLPRQGLKICELRTLTMNVSKWERMIEIETPNVKFPEEHILILAQKTG